jgi:hypothetical protein
MKNIIKTSNMYNASGYLTDYSTSREKQGLLPQGLASLLYIDTKPRDFENNPYFGNVMYPYRPLYVTYGTEMPSNCPCTANLYGELTKKTF